MKSTLILLFVFIFSGVWATNYYVNDGSTIGDVYTNVVGNGANDGLSPNTPKALASAIISTYVLTGGDTVFIDAGAYTDELKLNALNGAGNHIVFAGADSSLTTITGVPGSDFSAPINPYEFVVQVYNSSWICLQNLTLLEAPGNDWIIQVYGNSDNNLIQQCRIDGYYGVDVEGGDMNDNVIRDNWIRGEWVGVRLKNGAYDNLVHDNFIRVENGSTFSALEFQSAWDNKAYRNKLSSNGQCVEGVIHAGHSSNNNEIINNYIINETAPGAQLNVGIEVDDNSAFIIQHNSFHTVGYCFRFNDDASSGVGSMNNMTLENNIFYSTQERCIWLRYATERFGSCINNLYYAPGTGFVAHTGGTDRNYASWIAYDPDVGGGNGANSVSADPQYTNPVLCDLSLPQASPAVDAVFNDIVSITDDIFQTSRPIGIRKDIGAYEWEDPMPVTLVKFEVNCSDNYNQLTWKTVMEENNDFFTIESSEDGTVFEPVALVAGAGNSHALLEYNYEDRSKGAIYYRIKQTDYDGSFSYSQLRYAACSASVFDIVDKESTIEVYNTDKESFMIIISDISGKVLHTGTVYNQFKLEKNNYPFGVYILKVMSGKNHESVKFVIR